MWADADLKCPFCPGRARFVRRGFFAMHSVPPCQVYQDAEDSLTFLILVRKALGIANPTGDA